MRIWSIHPKYLDAKGIVALWRETLLAKNVLEGKTNGYKNHPQLNRFKNSVNPLDSINQYLEIVYQEAVKRDYNFDKSKFKSCDKPISINVSQGQIEYEFKHLLSKLNVRDKERYVLFKKEINIESHPLFTIVPGGIESWEII